MELEAKKKKKKKEENFGRQNKIARGKQQQRFVQIGFFRQIELQLGKTNTL